MKRAPTDEEIRKVAFKLLGHRDLSESELTEKLKKRGFAPERIKEILTDLKQMRYIDDQSLCERQVRYLAWERLWGDKRIEVTLLAKGLSPSLVKETLARIRHEIPEAEALRMYIQKAGSKKVTAGKLIYRGFPPNLVYEFLNGRADNEGR